MPRGRAMHVDPVERERPLDGLARGDGRADRRREHAAEGRRRGAARSRQRARPAAPLEEQGAELGHEDPPRDAVRQAAVALRRRRVDARPEVPVVLEQVDEVRDGDDVGLRVRLRAAAVEPDARREDERAVLT